MASTAFLARRNTATIASGDRVIVQTGAEGQVGALVMGERDGDILVRFSRWGAVVAVEPAAILRRLDGARP